jgi:hypothetical protein
VRGIPEYSDRKFAIGLNYTKYSTMSDARKELREIFRSAQHKYVYYLVAIDVSALGFASYNTMGNSLEWHHIPLGIAVLCWLISAYNGLRFITTGIGAFYDQHEVLALVDKAEEHLKKFTFDKGMERLNELYETKEHTLTKCKWFLFGGVAAFIAWRVVDMALVNH